MSVYNGAEHVVQAIDSILSQSLPGFEFIIVDDGSTDSTLEILSSFPDPRIILLENESNVGLAAHTLIGFSDKPNTWTNIPKWVW